MNNTYLKPLRVTLDQWRTLQAVIEHGGFAQAARALQRSQSSISYTLARLQEQLGIALLKIEGRKAVLTDNGMVMLKRSRQLLQQANQLEALAAHLQQGWEAEVRLAVDAAYPTARLAQSLSAFHPKSRGCRLALHEGVLSSIQERLLNEQSDVIISPLVIPNYPVLELGRVALIAVAHPSHPLHRLARKLNMQDLQDSVQIMVGDAQQHYPSDGPAIGQPWTVASLSSAVSFALRGLGFAWLPQHLIEPELDAGRLRSLPLMQGSLRHQTFYLYTHNSPPGPATETLIQLIKEYATDPLFP